MKQEESRIGHFLSTTCIQCGAPSYRYFSRDGFSSKCWSIVAQTKRHEPAYTDGKEKDLTY